MRHLVSVKSDSACKFKNWSGAVKFIKYKKKFISQQQTFYQSLPFDSARPNGTLHQTPSTISISESFGMSCKIPINLVIRIRKTKSKSIYADREKIVILWLVGHRKRTYTDTLWSDMRNPIDLPLCN